MSPCAGTSAAPRSNYSKDNDNDKDKIIKTGLYMTLFELLASRKKTFNHVRLHFESGSSLFVSC
jgi:hypothetical protein